MVPLLNQRQDEDDSVSDETILNVIRNKGEKVITTSEIADDLTITQSWTSNRLNELETKGRIHSKSAGQGRVWWLDESEPAHHVAESIDDLMWYASEADQAATNVWIMCAGMFIIGGFLMIPIFLLEVFPRLTMIPFTVQDFATGAMLAAIGGSLFLIGGCALKLTSLWIQRRFAITE